MMEKLRKWWDAQLVGEQKDSAAVDDEVAEVERRAEETLERSTKDLDDTRQLLSEARDKNIEADRRIQNYQKRIREENDRRISYTRGERRDR